MKWDTVVISARQQGTYRMNFKFDNLPADEWPIFFRIGRPAWSHPIRRVQWELANLDLRYELESRGVRL